jgi:hypothetical protein
MSAFAVGKSAPKRNVAITPRPRRRQSRGWALWKTLLTLAHDPVDQRARALIDDILTEET